MRLVIGSLFYTFVKILSDGMLVWNQILSSKDLRAVEEQPYCTYWLCATVEGERERYG